MVLNYRHYRAKTFWTRHSQIFENSGGFDITLNKSKSEVLGRRNRAIWKVSVTYLNSFFAFLDFDYCCITAKSRCWGHQEPRVSVRNSDGPK